MGRANSGGPGERRYHRAMRVHLLEFDIVWEDKAGNHAIVRSMLEGAAAEVQPGDLVLMPEMFDTGFSFNVEAIADGLVAGPGADAEPGEDRGPTASFLSALAQRWGVWVIAGQTLRVRGLTSRRGGAMGVNRALLIDPAGTIVGHYDKVHPFSYGHESERYLGGRAVQRWRVGPSGEPASTIVSPVICYDLRFPELFRAAMDTAQPPEVFVVLANWPASRAHHWRSLCVARAIENQAYVVGVNRIGRDPHLEYAGTSLIVDPMGGVVAESPGACGVGVSEAGACPPGVISATLDLASLREWRARFPALRDRRSWRDGTAYERLASGQPRFDQPQ
jgi:omega-amidase